MPKFVFVYHGGGKPSSPDDVGKVKQKWRDWMGGLGSDLVDGGNPVGKSTTVYADRVADDGGSNPTSGYSLVNAKDINDAVAKAKGCPILASGGSIEVAEAMEM